MKQQNLITFILLLICTISGEARGQAVSKDAQSGTNPPPRTVSQVLDIWISNTETQVVPLADAMPEEKYSFAPTTGEFKGVRTFAEQVKHLAAFNYLAANFILGRTPTLDQKEEAGPETVKTKAEVMEYLKGSFALLHQAVARIDDKNLIEALPDASKGRLALALETRLALAIDAMAHSFDHYGQMVEYLRMNGIVPPASR